MPLDSRWKISTSRLAGGGQHRLARSPSRDREGQARNREAPGRSDPSGIARMDRSVKINWTILGHDKSHIQNDKTQAFIDFFYHILEHWDQRSCIIEGQ